MIKRNGIFLNYLKKWVNIMITVKPTVVYHSDKPIVYDGNRRIAILKYLQNLNCSFKLEGKLLLSKRPENLKNTTEIMCNVCNKETALKNIERKHINSGSWGLN